MVEVEQRATTPVAEADRSERRQPGNAPHTLLGSVVFAASMFAWAGGQYVYGSSVAAAWGLFIGGGIGASIGLQLAVTPRNDRGGSWSSHDAWLSSSLTAMLVLVGFSSTFDGAARTIAVSAGVSILVAGFARAMAERRSAQQRIAELAVIDERQRVAADVHDIVGHALAVTMLHVNAARLSLPEHPDSAIEALREAERNGRSSMNEIRGVVRLLRSTDGDSLLSLPDLGDLPALVESFRGTGSEIDVADGVGSEDVSRLASVTAYRLVQEGLTNAVRYGVGAIEVRLGIDDADLALSIENRVGRGGRHGDGVGLAAARARVTSIGGTFDAGPLDATDRWRLAARIPT